MGVQYSLAQTQLASTYCDNGYLQIPSDDNLSQILPSTKKNSSLFRTEYSGIWSVTVPNCICPHPRTGQFTVYDENKHIAYIGYGVSEDGAVLRDLWSFDTISKVWKEIQLSGDNISPRGGARAVLDGDYILVFGGFKEPDYFSDLHSIEISTGKISIIEAKGTQPEPRSTPIFAIYNEKLYIWGGYNGKYPSDLHVFDIGKREWSSYPQDISGRTAIPSVTVDSKIYCYGGAKVGGLLVIDMDKNEVRVEECSGTEPSCGIMGSGMVKVDHFLILFGGRATSKYSVMYAMDINTNWWFVFHVRPDGKTVSMADGSINELGLFMVPRTHSFSAFYESKSKQVLALLGFPENSPPPIFELSIGEALGNLHMRDDMIQCLRAPTREQ